MQESKTGKWRRVLVKVSVCLLTSHPIPNAIFTFAPSGVVLKMYENTIWHSVISNLLSIFLVDMPILCLDFIESTDETRGEM